MELYKLVGNHYKKDNQVFFVEGVEKKSTNILIQTDRKSVVIYDTQNAIEKFLSEIEIVEIDKKDFVPAPVEISVRKPVYPAEVMNAMSVSEKMTTSLMDIFDQLSNKPTDETYKKASAMVSVANSVVNVQVTQIKFLNLKK